MRICNVNFPAQLFEAQKNGSLVVFAGAGVSIPRPSNFPNFDKLAETVAAGMMTREKDEPVDRFLGRLKDRRVEVHDKVRRILSDPVSKPNSLHEDLLRLFENASKIRVVTTNFDLHFTTATAILFPGSAGLEVYSAPALPLGSSFFGIVHLHGSIAKPPDRLVLTDSDFGAAYLTDGWATRFLQQLFTNNVVLFVGYSHNDVVIDYLARGLPPKSKGPGRFAIAIEGTEAHWARLGISPITYPVGTDGEEHSALAPTIRGWVDRIWTAALDHEERIKQIVQRPVPLNLEELDYIEWACREKHLAQFFTRYARTPDWLRWAESKELLKTLFEHKSELAETDQQFALWFAQHFACQHPEEALAVVQRHAGLIPTQLWYQIALAFHQQKPSHEVAAKWVPFLVNAEPPWGNKDLLAYRLCACSYPEDQSTILLLFEHLTRPRPRLEKRIWPSEDGNAVEMKLMTEGAEYWLNQAWLKLLQPNLGDLADKLLVIATSHIQHAYFLLRSFGKDNPDWDALSSSRGQIEAGGQDSLRDTGLQVLIDVARDALLWTNDHNPLRTDSLIDMWFSSGLRLLRRLAIFGVAEAHHWTADSKLKWLVTHELLYTYGYKPEVYRVFKKSYAIASETTRLEVLEEARRGLNVSEDIHAHYQLFNLLYWLTQAAPACAETKKRFDELASEHPEFGPREHPDLDWWVGPSGWVGPTSALDTNEILSLSIEELLKQLTTAKPDEIFARGRDGLLYKIRETVARNYGWSMGTITALQQKEIREPDLWAAIIGGWKSTSLSEEHWTEVLSALLRLEHITPPIIYEISQLLASGIDQPSHVVPDSSLGIALQVAHKMWEACASAVPQESTTEDWLQVAINHPAGNLVRFWLHVLSRQRKTAGDQWNGISPQLKSYLDAVVQGTSDAADVGRVLLASELLFLFSLDRVWALQNVLPLLKLWKDPERTIQAWHGFLGWGRWSEDLLPYLLPCFNEAFMRLHSDFGKEHRRRFCDYLASIASYSSVNPVEDGWLNKFLITVTTEERAIWAASMLQMLKAMKEVAAETAWKNWIETYWDNRLDGIPVPLEPSETAQMVHWTIYFKFSFPTVTNKVYKGPVPVIENSWLHHELSESDLPQRHPVAVAQFLQYLLDNHLVPEYYFDPVVNIVKKLQPFAEARGDLLQVCHRLAELGYAGAAALRDSITTSINQLALLHLP